MLQFEGRDARSLQDTYVSNIASINLSGCNFVLLAGLYMPQPSQPWAVRAELTRRFPSTTTH